MNRSRPIRLFCSDLDGTLTGPEPVLPFTRAWSRLPRSGRPVLVYSTGRLAEDARNWVAACGLPQSDFLISGVGTAIHGRSREFPEFTRGFAHGWNSAAVRACLRSEPGIVPQARRFHRRYKSSWHWPGAGEADLSRLRRRLEAAGLRANLIYSQWRDLDVLPAGAGKGPALAWLCRSLNIPLDAVVVAGDRGNDAEMFALPGVRSLAMPHSDAILGRSPPRGADFYQARGMGAAGVVEGLRAHGLFKAGPQAAPAERRSPRSRPRGR